MNSEQNLIDSFLGFGIESSGGLAEMNSTGNDGRLENGEDTRFRRPSDPKSPVSADSSKFVSPPTGVGGILEASLDQQLNSNSTSEYDHSPQRYAEQKEAFTNDTFTLGAISRFNNDEDNQSSGRFASGGTIEGASYVIHEPSDVAGLAPLGQLSSKVSPS